MYYQQNTINRSANGSTVDLVLNTHMRKSTVQVVQSL